MSQYERSQYKYKMACEMKNYLMNGNVQRICLPCEKIYETDRNEDIEDGSILNLCDNCQ